MTRKAAASLLFAFAVAAAPLRGALPFVEDDYGGALTQARSRHVPIFVEAWAPW